MSNVEILKALIIERVEKTDDVVMLDFIINLLAME